MWKEEQTFIQESSWGRKKRPPVALGIGLTHRVCPMNPRAKKHRDRICTIIEFEEHFLPTWAAFGFTIPVESAKLIVLI
jgi:hypothetical protein